MQHLILSPTRAPVFRHPNGASPSTVYLQPRNGLLQLICEASVFRKELPGLDDAQLLKLDLRDPFGLVPLKRQGHGGQGLAAVIQARPRQPKGSN